MGAQRRLRPFLDSHGDSKTHILSNKVRKEKSMPDIETIAAREIDRYLNDKRYLLIDVREPADYRRMHIRGAVCIPHEYLLQRIQGLGHTVPILYCDRGGLSMQAARELVEHGYRAISVVGGIQAYRGRYLERDFRQK